MTKSIITATALGIVAKAISSIGLFVIIPIMLAKLGNETFGIWMTISAAVGLFSFLDLGIGNNLINYIGNSRNNRELIVKYISLGYFIQFCIIGLILFLFSVLFDFINWASVFNLKDASYNITSAIFISFCCFLLSLITNTIYAIQRGFQKIELANGWQIISSLFYLGSIILVLYIQPTLPYLAIATFGAPVFISFINSIYFLYNNKLLKVQYCYENKSLVKEFIGDSGGFFFLQVAALIAFQTDVLILAHFSNFNAVSQYSIVARLFSIPAVVLALYVSSLWPAYTNAAATSNWGWIRKAFYRSMLFSLIIVIGFIAIIILFRNEIFSLWLNNEIEIPLSLFVAFSIWSIINNSVDTHLGVLLNSLHKLRVQIVSALSMIVLNIALSIYLTREFGAAGVVWGTIISTFLCSTIPMFFYVQRLISKNLNK